MTPAFVARVAPMRILMFAGLAATLTALAAWLATAAALSMVEHAVGWAGLLFFGACTIVIVRQAFRTGPVLEVTSAGIRWVRWSDVVIPWDAIARAEPKSLDGQTFLTLWFRDPSRYPSSSLLSKLQGANKALGFGDIALSTHGTDKGLKDLGEAVHAHAPHLFD